MNAAATTATAGSMRRHIPNLLTGARVVLACVLFAVLSAWSYADSPAARGGGSDLLLLAAAMIFVVGAATDALDGWLARRWQVVSVFGRIMDPFADKLLVIGAFVFLASPAFLSPSPAGRESVGVQVSGVYAWMVSIVLARELLVTSIRGAMEGAGVSFAAGWSGKVKMILQSVVVPAVMVIVATAPGAAGGVWSIVIRAMVWATVAVTAWSGVPYVVRAAHAARTVGAARPGSSA